MSAKYQVHTHYLSILHATQSNLDTGLGRNLDTDKTKPSFLRVFSRNPLVNTRSPLEACGDDVMGSVL